MKSLATWPKGKKALKASTVTATPSQCTRGEFRIAMWRKENGTATAAKETEKEERERDTREASRTKVRTFRLPTLPPIP